MRREVDGGVPTQGGCGSCRHGAGNIHARCLLESVLDGAAVALHSLGNLARPRTDAGEAGLEGARTAVLLLELLDLTCIQLSFRESSAGHLEQRLAGLHMHLVAQVSLCM